MATVKDNLVTDDPETGVRIVRNAETDLGDLCADAIRAAAGTDIAVMNGGGIRAGLRAGEITYGDVLSVFPFGNHLRTIEVTGQQLLDALELSVSKLPEENGGFLQVSGLTRAGGGFVAGLRCSVGFSGRRIFKRHVFVYAGLWKWANCGGSIKKANRRNRFASAADNRWEKKAMEKIFGKSSAYSVVKSAENGKPIDGFYTNRYTEHRLGKGGIRVADEWCAELMRYTEGMYCNSPDCSHYQTGLWPEPNL